jgi:hypothetical protein
MIPTQEEIEKFKAELSQMGAEEVGQKLRHHTYGAKDNWKYKEALSFIEAHKEAIETDLKRESIKQAQENNRLQEQANKTARWALFISFVALVISILVAIFK